MVFLKSTMVPIEKLFETFRAFMMAQITTSVPSEQVLYQAFYNAGLPYSVLLEDSNRKHSSLSLRMWLNKEGV